MQRLTARGISWHSRPPIARSRGEGEEIQCSLSKQIHSSAYDLPTPDLDFLGRFHHFLITFQKVCGAVSARIEWPSDDVELCEACALDRLTTERESSLLNGLVRVSIREGKRSGVLHR